MTQKQKSTCCSSPISTNFGEEGTNCYVCDECKKPCDVKFSKTQKIIADILKESIKTIEKAREKTHNEYPKLFKAEFSYSGDPQIGFPHYHRGGLLQLFRKIQFGWKIIGRIKSLCSNCNKRLYAGEENGKRFSFCKGCLKK